MKEIENYFRPEFINRLDEVIVFHPLTREDLVTIVEYESKKVRERLDAKGIRMELAESAKDFLIEKGYNPDFGARPLRRAIGTHIEDALSESVLRGDFEGKNVLKISHHEGDENLTFESSYEEPPKDESESDEKPEPVGAGASGEGTEGSGDDSSSTGDSDS